MTKAKVVITDYAWESIEVERATLADLAHVVASQTTSSREFLVHAADCDALLNAYSGPIIAETMEAMPRCKIIAKYGIGVDTVDLEAATEVGIIVTNNPTYCIEEVAEHTMALILASARKVAFYDRQVRGGSWAVPPGKPLFPLKGSTLGLVGFGNIAREVARRASAFGMRVLHGPVRGRLRGHSEYGWSCIRCLVRRTSSRSPHRSQQTREESSTTSRLRA